MGTKIEWTEETWNPLVGCEYASPGCRGCYAARDAFGRLKGSPIYAGLAIKRTPDELPRFTGEVRLLEERLDQPRRWRRPRKVFVNSMSDLFHPDVPEWYVRRVFDVMAAERRHTFQVLTKRPQRMAALTHERAAMPAEVDGGCELGVWPSVWDTANGGLPAPNVWLGTSIENAKYLWRLEHLRAADAAVRFVSWEPLLGDVGDVDLTGIDWCIVGGESGPQARPMHVAWARRLRDQCVEQGVAFLFKQWGEWGWPARPTDHALTIDGRLLEPGHRLGMDHLARPTFVRKVGKRAAGRLLDGRTWDEYPCTVETVETGPLL